MVREGVCGVRSGGLGYVDISQIQVKCLCCGRQEWRPYNIIYGLVDSKNAKRQLAARSGRSGRSGYSVVNVVMDHSPKPPGPQACIHQS